MTDISYMPWKEIILHDVVELGRDEFAEAVIRLSLADVRAGLTPEVRWVDGIAFIAAEFPETERVVAERLNGILHYDRLVFSRMQYEPQIKTRVGGQEYPIRLVNVEKNLAFKGLVDFLSTFDSLLSTASGLTRVG